jgi:putative restriction endonuclease
MSTWVEAVTAAVGRHVARSGTPLFTRRGLEAEELAAIVAATGTTGVTPGQTLGRELQQLRDAGRIEFLGRGVYRWLGDIPAEEPAAPSKAIFAHAGDAGAGELLSRQFTFPMRWRSAARSTEGQWIIYRGAQGYHAAARVARIGRGDAASGLCRARLVEDSYLEFGAAVTALDDAWTGEPSVRLITEEEFDRIVDLGLIDEELLLPRSDEPEQFRDAQSLAEGRLAYEAPVSRATMLVSRKVRDRQFRKRVLDAYESRCALTGMKLVNGGGRVETEAAHIMSVEAGGPDSVQNGIALSGTVHWMFDRGLISLSDGGEIILSRAINDRDGVERLINRDGRAHLPLARAERPHPRYLAWHRSECFHH